MNDLLTTVQVAERLHVTPETVRGMIADGRLRAVKPGRHWLVDEADLAIDLRSLENRPRRRRRRAVAA